MPTSRSSSPRSATSSAAMRSTSREREPDGQGLRLMPSRHAPPAALTVFGASGDLAHRKLFPALAGLADQGLLPEAIGLVGVARTDLGDDGFRKRLHDAAPT